MLGIHNCTQRRAHLISVLHFTSIAPPSLSTEILISCGMDYQLPFPSSYSVTMCSPAMCSLFTGRWARRRRGTRSPDADAASAAPAGTHALGISRSRSGTQGQAGQWPFPHCPGLMWGIGLPVPAGPVQAGHAPCRPLQLFCPCLSSSSP